MPVNIFAFVVGDVVSWDSQAGGVWKTKTGTVIEVVPAGQGRMGSGPRRHGSYVVEVIQPSNSPFRTVKSKRYWPVVSLLRKVES